MGRLFLETVIGLLATVAMVALLVVICVWAGG